VEHIDSKPGTPGDSTPSTPDDEAGPVGPIANLTTYIPDRLPGFIGPVPPPLSIRYLQLLYPNLIIFVKNESI
jgi:hypothetical protein